MSAPIISAQVLFWAEEGAVLKSKDLASGVEMTLFQTDAINIASNRIEQITVDRNNQKVYFRLHTEDPWPQQDLLMAIDYTGENLTQLDDFFYASSMEYHHGENKLYYSVSNGSADELGIRSFDVQTSEDNLILNCQFCLNVKLDENDGKIFFNNPLVNHINLDGTGLTELSFVAPPLFGGQSGYDINPITNQIFWLESVPGPTTIATIKKATFDGTNIETLFTPSNTSGDSIYLIGPPFVDEERSKIYYFFYTSTFFNEGGTTSFRRSNLNGTSLEILTPFEKTAWTIDPNVEETDQGIAIRHYHYLPEHPSFDGYTFLNSAITSSTDFQEFKVCTDGTDASVFEINFFFNAPLEQGDFILRIQEDPNGDNPDIYGSFGSLPPTSDNVITISYNHPEYIESGINGDYIHIQLVETATEDVKLTIPLALYLPPVLFVHGLNSSGKSFKALQKYIIDNDQYPLELTYNVDYEDENDEEFQINSAIIPANTDGIIKEAVFYGFSVGQVNIVAHSMGGILSRLYLQSNFYLNEINKLITVNTPHSGTQLPNYILDPNANATAIACFAMLIGSGGNCFAGAVGDLRVDSDAITNVLNGSSLNFNVTPSHAIVTTHNLSATEVIGTGLILGTYLPLIFNGSNHDIVVPLESQLGGLSSQNISAYEGRHDGSYNLEDVKTRISELLKYNSNYVEFAQNGFNPATLSYKYQPINPPNTMIGTLNIESSFENQTINYGDEIDIQVTPNSPSDIVTILYNGTSLFGKRDSAEEFINGNVSIDRALQPSRLGKIPITAIAVNQTDETISNDTLIIDVTTDVEPLSIEGTPTIALLGKNSSPSIWADFGDEKISISAATGIQYNFKNGLAEYIGNGYIRPLGIGVDSFTVTFNGVTSPEFRIRISDGIFTNTSEPSKPKTSSKKLDITVFPNPVRDEINVKANIQEPSSFWLRITTTTGKTVLSKKSFELHPNTSKPLSVSHLPNGVYFLTIYNHLGNSTSKFIKQ